MGYSRIRWGGGRLQTGLFFNTPPILQIEIGHALPSPKQKYVSTLFFYFKCDSPFP